MLALLQNTTKHGLESKITRINCSYIWNTFSRKIQIFQFPYNPRKNISSSLTDHKNLFIFILEKTDGQNPENTLVRKHFVFIAKKHGVG